MRNNRLATLCTLTLLAAALAPSCKKQETQQVPTAKVARGTFYIDLYEEGEVEAVNAITIPAPLISWRYASNLKITYIVKDGTEVKSGDTVLVFDPSEVSKAIIESQGKLEISGAEMEKMVAQQNSDMEELMASYEVTKISLEISQIKLDQAAHESGIARKQIQLNLDKAQIALDKAKEEIENRKKINAEEIKQKKLAIAQDQARLDEANEALRQLTVISPSSGIAILSKNWMSGNKYQVGDQVWGGQALITLPNLDKLKATVKINEIDIAKIIQGLKAEIRPDAFSEETFTGQVQSVANLAVDKDDKSRIKVFPVEIYINETNKNLLPGLTVSCRLIIDQIEDVLYVPTEAIHTEGDKNYVYKKVRGKYEKTEVETGMSNSNHTIIVQGIGEKDEVALADPFAVEKKEEAETTTQPQQP